MSETNSKLIDFLSQQIRDNKAAVDTQFKDLDSKIGSLEDKMDARINSLEENLGGKLDTLFKFRWQIVGGTAAISTLVSIAIGVLTIIFARS